MSTHHSTNHEHNHAHHHEHNHDHIHEHRPISITTHDMSVVGSYKFSIEKPYDVSEIILDKLMKQLAKEITDSNGIVGHIKAFLTTEKGCMISITELDSNKRYTNETKCDVEGVAIVFYIEPEKLESLIRSVFKEYIK